MKAPRREKPRVNVETAPETGPERPRPISRLLAVFPIAWLALLLVAYARLALEPLDHPAAEVAGVQQLDPLALPLLAAAVLAGIIQYFVTRQTRS